MSAADATIAPFVRDPGAAAMLLDFDGSLAPIVERPEAARPLSGAAPVLARLVGALGRVGVVSGRPVDFLAEMLPVEGISLAGVYGVERLEAGERHLDPRVEPYLEAVAAAADEAERRLPGVLVERKASVSVTLHWRTCPEREGEVRDVADELVRAHGLDGPLRGKAAVELRPPVPIDKGTAVAQLVEDVTVAAFAGDDAGDLPAFEALERLRSDGRLATTLRIGVRSSEAPPEVLDRADLVVDGPEGLLAWLERLADALDGR